MKSTTPQSTDVVQMRQGIYLSDMVDPLGYHQSPPLQCTSQPRQGLAARLAKTPVPATIDDASQGAGAGTLSEVFRISPVCAWCGALWQWRTVRCKMSGAVRPSAGPVRCLVPFLLLPGADALLRRPCVSIEALQRGRDMTSSLFAATDVESVAIDSAIGVVSALVRGTDVTRERASAPRETALPEYCELKSRTIDSSKYLSWYDAEFRQLERQLTFAPETPAAAAYTVTCPATTECATQRRPDETHAAYSRRRWDAVHARAGRRESGAIQGESKVVLPTPYVRIFVEEEDEGAAAVAANRSAAQHAARGTESHPSCLPGDLCNALCGGLAETALAADRYASLIVRHDLSIAAACWALLSDTRSHAATMSLRDNALAIEREVLAAVTAHERARGGRTPTSTQTLPELAAAEFDFVHFPSTLR